MNQFEKALQDGDLAALRQAVEDARSAAFASKVAELNQARAELAALEAEHVQHVAGTREARMRALDLQVEVREAQQAADQAARDSGLATNREEASRREIAEVRARIAELEASLRGVLEAEAAPVVHNMIRPRV